MGTGKRPYCRRARVRLAVRKKGSFSFPASRERHARIRNRASAAFAARADRRWLLAPGQNENPEAAVAHAPRPPANPWRKHAFAYDDVSGSSFRR
jgi:hypothetical protein